jgi:hypothetical protein
VVAATRLEAWAARRAIGSRAPVLRSGVKASRPFSGEGALIVCGLAGSLTEALPPGSVLVPSSIGLPSGQMVECDPALQNAFARAARELAFEPSFGAVVTLPEMTTGSARETWRQRGFIAVDMESGLVAGPGRHLGVVRVTLDGPGHEISREWMSPLGAITRPRLWPQALRLAIDAPRYALRAGQVVARGLSILGA